MPNIKTPVVAIAIAMHLLCTNSHTQAATALPTTVEKLSTVEGISEYRLPNGLKILLIPDNSKPTATVSMIYQVGSKHESAGQTGYAHLLEHMMCKGSKNYPQILQQLLNRGMKSNAFTFQDYTLYYATFEASENELNWVLSMEADRMQNAQVLKSELDTEMTVVRNELELRENNSYDMLFKRVQAVAFDWHGYGHSTIGEKSDIENVNIDQLKQFYHTYYRPDNAVLVVAGKFDADAVLPVISRQFGSIAAPRSALPKIITVEPAQQGERQVFVRKKSKENRMMLAYHKPSLLHPDYAALKMAGAILSSGRELRNQTGDVFLSNIRPGFNMAGNVENGLAVFYSNSFPSKDMGEGPQELTKAVETFGQHSLSQQELDLFKNAYVNNFVSTMNNPQTLSLRLSDYIAAGDWRLLFVEKKRVASLTATQVQDAARRYFVKENRTAGILLSEDESTNTQMPQSPSLAEVMKDFSYVDQYAAVAEFDRTISNIEKNTQRLKIGHIETALLSKPTRGQAVEVDLLLHWGDEKTLFNKRWVEFMTMQGLLNGTSRYGKETLQAERQNAQIRGGVTRFTTDRSHLKQALQLMVENLKQPSFAQAYSQLGEFKQEWQKLRADPQQLIQDELARHFNAYPAGDMRAHETSEQVVAALGAIKPTDLIDFHKNFYGASSGHLAIIGDFDVEEVKAVLNQEFSGWESKSPYAEIHKTYVGRPSLQKFIDTPGKENGFFLAQLNLPVGIKDEDFIALQVIDHLIGGNTFGSRLGQRVRVKEGWSYGIHSDISPFQTDSCSTWEIKASAASANINKLKQAVLEELRRVVSQGFSQDELTTAKTGLLQQWQQSRNNDKSLTEQWNSVMHTNEDYSWYARREQSVQNLSLEQLNKAAKKYLQPEQWSIVMTGDASKIPKDL
ncbi:M16 family metallopeptidase [Undibacterium sp. Ji42W]|uniref:M16 family metallopeptidase n=1 Tax=Undibacterium sp. Ji42W TaxID=3413039 RepID=UPI003BF0D9AE